MKQRPIQYVEAVALGVLDPSTNDVLWKEWEEALTLLGYRLGKRFKEGMVLVWRGNEKLYSHTPIYVSRFIINEQEKLRESKNHS